jgi:hypothetical protein
VSEDDEKVEDAGSGPGEQPTEIGTERLGGAPKRGDTHTHTHTHTPTTKKRGTD